MKTFLLTVSYDGTTYHGWQRQTGQSTVQQTLEEALCVVTGRETAVTASGRTDEGVHALGQAVSFVSDTLSPAANLPAALNAVLPADIRALNCREAADGFCARKAAKRKTYAYRLYLSPHPLPQWERYALRVTNPLDEPLWRENCARIEGTHDFAAFRCLGSSAKTTVRTVFECSFAFFPASGITPPLYEFRICGDGFLYKTVRLLVGALLRLESKKITADDFAAALSGDETRVPKIPAPSKGLTLLRVEYSI